MILAFCDALSAALAWGLGLRYIGIKRKSLVPAVAAAGVLGGLAGWLCAAWEACAAGEGLLPRILCGLLPLAVCLVLPAVVRLGFRRCRGDAWLAFCLALGARSVLGFAGKALGGFGPWAMAAATAVFLALFLVLTLRLSANFPDVEWRSYYTSPSGEGLPLRPGHIYAIAAVTGGVTAVSYATACLFQVLCGGSCGLAPGTMVWGNAAEGNTALADPWSRGAVLWDAVLWAVVLALLFWGGILLMLLIHTYKKEHMAVMMEQQYRDEVLSFMDVIRSQRHDYNFHVQTIAGLVREGRYEECEKYVDELEEDSASMNVLLPVKDPAIAAMLHAFLLKAGRENIRLTIDIQNDLSAIATNVYETNKIISNLLQNALDETMNHKDKSWGIHLMILKRGEYCVIRVANALEQPELTAQALDKIYQRGYTTKPDHDGVGLSSIRALVARYRGTIYTQLEDHIIHFVVKIPVNYAR